MREKRLPLEAVETASSCTKRARMSRTLGVGEIDLHHQVMSGDIDNIQDHRYRMSCRTFFTRFFAGQINPHGSGRVGSPDPTREG